MPEHSSRGCSQSEADAAEQLLGRFLSGGGDSPISSVRGVKTRIGVVVICSIVLLGKREMLKLWKGGDVDDVVVKDVKVMGEEEKKWCTDGADGAERKEDARQKMLFWND